MLTFAYSQSTLLKDTLEAVSSDRTNILTTPIPPKTLMRLRWESTIARVFWTLSLEDIESTKSDVSKLLMKYPVRTMLRTDKLKLLPSEHTILSVKETLDVVRGNWVANPDPITVSTLVKINAVSSRGRLMTDESKVRHFLEYLQSANEHPVIQAAIAHIQIDLSTPFSIGNLRTGVLTGYLFLTKYGFDMRELLILADYFKRTRMEYNEIAEHTRQTENVTRWLEYYAGAIANNLTKIKQDIIANKAKSELPPSFWELTDRQKAILSLLDVPGSTFTNRQAQKLFKVSQITSSRDLTKLASLGIIFSHGKGRSVYYSKV